MPKPENFTSSTDYATLKGDNSGTATVTIPSSTVVPGNALVEWHADINIGRQGAVAKAQISSSKNSNKVISTNATSFIRFGTVLGFGAIYEVYIFVWRPSANVLRCQAIIQNPYSDPLTGVSGDEVINYYVNTFLPPFA